SIMETARRLLEPKPLTGKRVMVTAGPTHEALDPVRFLGNRSSGKMAWAIADAALRAGAEVVLIHGPVTLQPPLGAECVAVQSAGEMLEAVEAVWRGKEDAANGEQTLEPRCYVAIMVAAVADYRPRSREERKIRKQDGHADGLTLDLVTNPDILATVSGWSRQAKEGQSRSSPTAPLVVGFAAETGDALQRGRDKRLRKGCDLLVVNDVSETGCGFGSETNRVTVLGPGSKETPWPLISKQEVGERLIARIGEIICLEAGE
ncbi:MAG: hypothetical protein HQL50_08950, partial [Magnetococcales bacterium]|nr:hypothetical protein [Magnetococcales bacterium]